ncbi:MAG: thioredoxin family protein [Candidatus Pacebacteria bacterium]|nr:thioredoxin family protein [Candidatus Paceibacterota bacterium]
MDQHQRPQFEWKKYVITLVITVTIFGTALYINNIMDAKRVENVKAIQDRISLDLLSSETQFDLLKEGTCKNVNESVLSDELGTLATKLSYMEENDSSNPDLIQLKTYYSILEIKDFLLMQQLGQRCPFKPVSILYFYSKADQCPDCQKMSYVLTYLREQYPEVRIYSFDYDLGLSLVETMKSMYKIGNQLPAIVVGEKVYYGFIDIDQMKKIVPALKQLDQQHAKAVTSTPPGTSTSTNTGPNVGATTSTASTTSTSKISQ